MLHKSEEGNVWLSVDVLSLELNSDVRRWNAWAESQTGADQCINIIVRHMHDLVCHGYLETRGGDAARSLCQLETQNGQLNHSGPLDDGTEYGLWFVLGGRATENGQLEVLCCPAWKVNVAPNNGTLRVVKIEGGKKVVSNYVADWNRVCMKRCGIRTINDRPESTSAWRWLMDFFSIVAPSVPSAT